VGMGAVEIRQPRVRDLPEGVEAFRSEVVGRCERRSRTQGRLLARLYLDRACADSNGPAAIYGECRYPGSHQHNPEDEPAPMAPIGDTVGRHRRRGTLGLPRFDGHFC